MSLFRNLEWSDPAYEQEGLRVLTFKSPALKGRGDVTLFVPPGTGARRGLPLVVLLHGVYGSHWAWALKGGAHRTARALAERGAMRPMVLAMPSDGLWGDGSAYLAHGSADYEAWIMDDVVGCVTASLPCLGTGSPLFLGGLSMGGYGALRLGARHAARVAGISAHSALTHPRQLCGLVEEPLDAYGDMADETLGAAHWLVQNRAVLPPLRFDCGRDDAFLAANRQLHGDLLARGVMHVYDEFDGGHTWPYWQEHLTDTLLFFERQCTLLP